ncbi:MAG: peptidoglycan-binding protein [Bradyrhizobiaceae bacterium]|nr:peptidoglycan-binding protein [Bradyrhizobiaceae bacterium]
MISKLDLQRFSTSELAMGGAALAIVALVTLIDLRATQPRDPLSGQPLSASKPRDPLSIQPQSALQPRDQLPGPQSPLDQSSLEASATIDPPPSELSEPGGPIRQSPPQVEESVDPPSTNSRIAAQLPRQTTEIADPSEPELNPQNPSNAIWVQARLADLGYFTGSRSGVWGPVSRGALRDFKSMNGLQEDDQWDRETEQRLSSKQAVPAIKTFIGGWAEEIDQCRNGAPLVISSRAAKAVGGQCDFRSVKREGTAARWHVQAVCTDGGSSWNANVSLKLNSPQLIWSSERGTATYVRCAKPSPGESKPLVDSLGDWWQGVRKTVFVHE